MERTYSYRHRNHGGNILHRGFHKLRQNLVQLQRDFYFVVHNFLAGRGNFYKRHLGRTKEHLTRKRLQTQT